MRAPDPPGQASPRGRSALLRIEGKLSADELQRYMRNLAEVAYHCARASGHLRITSGDVAFAYESLSGSTCVH